MKFINFFLFLWVIFALLDPDPGTPLNPAPDPQHCFWGNMGYILILLYVIGCMKIGIQKKEVFEMLYSTFASDWINYYF
jgi:hypothetical protein